MLQPLTDARPRPSISKGSMEALSEDLRASTDAEIRFDSGSRALYATDASNYRQVPIGVVVPKSVEDVVTTVELCRKHNVPILSRGAGTSLCGQCCNVAVVIDFSKYLNRIIEIDRENKTARVQPGVVLDDLRDTAAKQGLTFAPDPATHTHNTLGGMVGNNSCGPHSVMAGKTQENIIELDVLTYDGTRMTIGVVDDARHAEILRGGGRPAEIHAGLKALGERYAEDIRARYPDIPRRVSGYNLDALLPGNSINYAQALVGTEGTCAVVLEATVKLVDNPPERVLLVLGYPSVFEAGDHVCEVMQLRPLALEGLDDRLAHDMQASGLNEGQLDLLPDGDGWLLVEFGGSSSEEAVACAEQAMETLSKTDAPPTMKLCADPEKQALIWAIRESGLGATAHVPHKRITWEGWEDAAVPPERLGEYLREFRALLEHYGYEGDLYGHFGQGCVHTRIDFDLETNAGIAQYRDFIRDAAQLAVRMGGSISGEHGDGQSKAELLPLMYGERLMQAFREFKAIWDPQGRMNPGKVIDAYRADENLRMGTTYDPPGLRTHFHYPEDTGDLSYALLRCVGVGKCRKSQGTMCPSYMATGEEMHSTRGRSRLLFEMMQGEVLKDGWKSEAVKESLDLCLSCKACKHECPTSVDMATYKAEFMSHYYKNRMRPITAHAFGHIDRWSRWASHAPGLVNFFTQHEPFASWAKRVAHIAPQRQLPRYANQTFTSRFRTYKPSAAASGRRVILWPDTFNNYFHPHVSMAAVRVLEHLGCDVVLPPVPLCCGRPLYEFGMLDDARKALQSILTALHDDIQKGTPVIGLEPACVSVFREEMPNLLPYNYQAKRLRKQTFLFSEYIEQRMQDSDAPVWPRLSRRALVHAHCHHKSVLSLASEKAVLERLGVDFEILDSGCCGMAGSFGYEREKYEVSMRCAERVLVPAVSSADADTLMVANGYSCREQITHATGRDTIHLAELLSAALIPYPEMLDGAEIEFAPPRSAIVNPK